jgi:hypothetical protein
MNKLLLLVLLVNPFVLAAQDSYIVNLKDVHVNLNNPTKDFKICFVIDGRQNKASIGWVNTGLANTTRSANFKNPLHEEITTLFERSNILSDDTTAWIVMISKLTISELAKNSSEVAIADVGLNFFQPFGGDSCHFIGSAFGSVQTRGLEVTKMHPENIADAFKNAINTFRRTGAESLQRKPYRLAELFAEGFDVKDHSSVAILNESKYPDGVFETFSDFLANKPFIGLPYEIEVGKSVNLWRLENDRKKKVRYGVVGFAKDNELYYLFDGDFYVLEKKSGAFHFIGPKLSDSRKILQSGMIGGLVGGAIAASATARKRVYRIDMESGGALEVGSIK